MYLVQCSDIFMYRPRGSHSILLPEVSFLHSSMYALFMYHFYIYEKKFIQEESLAYLRSKVQCLAMATLHSFL